MASIRLAMVALAYFGIKFLAYSAWIFWGILKFRGEPSPYVRAFLLGFFRLCLGFFFGVLIYLVSTLVISHIGSGLPQSVLAYLSVYVPVRWIEWSIMAVILVPSSFSQFLVGVGKPDRLWRVGGIVLSCLADIPLIISLGGVVPVGRFLC